METNYLTTKYKVKDLLPCKNCPLSLNNKENVVTLGTGNIISNTAFILPQYDINSKTDTVFDKLNKAWIALYGESITVNHYVTQLPKCSNKNLIVFDVTNTAVHYCINILIAELKHYCKNLNRIVICDKHLYNIVCKKSTINKYIQVIGISNPYKIDYNIEDYKNELIKAML